MKELGHALVRLLQQLMVAGTLEGNHNKVNVVSRIHLLDHLKWCLVQQNAGNYLMSYSTSFRPIRRLNCLCIAQMLDKWFLIQCKTKILMIVKVLQVSSSTLYYFWAIYSIMSIFVHTLSRKCHLAGLEVQILRQGKTVQFSCLKE